MIFLSAKLDHRRFVVYTQVSKATSPTTTEHKDKNDDR